MRQCWFAMWAAAPARRESFTRQLFTPSSHAGSDRIVHIFVTNTSTLGQMNLYMAIRLMDRWLVAGMVHRSACDMTSLSTLRSNCNMTGRRDEGSRAATD